MDKPSEIGYAGERLAAEYLLAEGHKILRRNYRIPGAEVDLITLCKGVLYAVEVKSMKALDSDFEILERLDARKLGRIRRGLGHYLSQFPVGWTEIRVAVITVRGALSHRPVIEFYEAFD